MTSDDLASDIQQWQDNQWGIECPDKPARSAVDLAQHLTAAGWQRITGGISHLVPCQAVLVFDSGHSMSGHITEVKQTGDMQEMTFQPRSQWTDIRADHLAEAPGG
ncbi:hypothetical protein [Arthrobacter sp. SX1312]|uniref:hypothetical protein n=1 Tax=Arthrobacter sp. SX1312 TaxID=2058896 RepID=UPI000CE44BB4|nr:hypothetical protein [Arthrobacter sp. SX1312]